MPLLLLDGVPLDDAPVLEAAEAHAARGHGARHHSMVRAAPSLRGALLAPQRGVLCHRRDHLVGRVSVSVFIVLRGT